MSEEKRKPVKVYRAKNVKIAIWEDTRKNKDGSEFNVYSANLIRSYKKKDSNDWVDEIIHTFDVVDLAKIQSVVSKAVGFLLDLKEE